MYSFIWVYLHRLVKLPVPMEPLLMPPVSQRCPSLYIKSMLPSFSHHTSLFSCSKEVETCVSHSSVILTLHVGHSWYSYWFMHFMIESFHIIQFSKSLVLDDGGCLNALLPADFIPSTSDHLFWDRNLESFLSALRLAVISGRFSRHRQFLGIHQCPLINGSFQVFNLNTFIHTF